MQTARRHYLRLGVHLGPWSYAAVALTAALLCYPKIIGEIGKGIGHSGFRCLFKTILYLLLFVNYLFKIMLGRLLVVRHRVT